MPTRSHSPNTYHTHPLPPVRLPRAHLCLHSHMFPSPILRGTPRFLKQLPQT
ncbi:hypothetical protein M405DRAFT_830971 [Rhizopogon salebrosus TDB-379]|nr:hypothetical protein M405DRAFT_830971 [Rhizopogon salebrosus TDB-379]